MVLLYTYMLEIELNHNASIYMQARRDSTYTLGGAVVGAYMRYIYEHRGTARATLFIYSLCVLLRFALRGGEYI